MKWHLFCYGFFISIRYYVFSPSHNNSPSSGNSKIASKTNTSSTRSSVTIPSNSWKSSVESLPTPRSESEILSSPHVKAFSFNELKNATRNFRPDSLLGEGGFGYVFKGWIDEHTLSAARPGSGMVIAVKKLKPEGFQGHKEWLVCFVPIIFVNQIYVNCLGSSLIGKMFADWS